jgi:hypothetical protein
MTANAKNRTFQTQPTISVAGKSITLCGSVVFVQALGCNGSERVKVSQQADFIAPCGAAAKVRMTVAQRC